MSFTLLKMTLKKNWILLIIFLGILIMYLSSMVSMYDPKDMSAINDMLKLFPEQLMKAMNFSGAVTDLTGYLASWLYGLLMLGFPLVYCVILGNKLVAKMVDNGSMAYLLSTPNSRVKIIVTQGVYALASVGALFAAIFGTGVLLCSVMFPHTLDIPAFLKLNLTTMLVNMAVMMISFFFSCVYNETKMSLAFGSGIPIVFLLANMLGGTSTKAEILKDLSIYGLFDPVKLVHGSSVLGVNIFYTAVTAVLFAAGVLIFKKKRLPL